MQSIPKDSLITVAGTVGAGKSTLTRALAATLNFEASFEKVDGNPYLELFYQDFTSWSFHLQIYFLAERFKEQKRIFDSGLGFVQDRSIYEDTGIFAKRLYEQGNMTKVDFETYTSLFEAMVMTPYFKKPDVLLYIKTDLEDVLERLHVRGRKMEQVTPVDYWVELLGRYEHWITEFDVCPVIEINPKEYDLINDPASISVITDKLNTFFENKKTRT